MRVLIGCEFGAGRGHIVFAKNVIQELRSKFPNVTVQVHLKGSHLVFEDETTNLDIRIIPSFRTAPSSKLTAKQTFGQMMFSSLTSEKTSWVNRLQYWQNAIDDFRPDVILAEYSPGLSSFARGRIPTVVTGTGYSLPPTHLKEFPMLQPTLPAFPKSEVQCVEELNLGLKAVGAQSLAYLPELNAGDFVGVTTIPLFDPYWETRRELYLGVELSGSIISPQRNTRNALGYFSGHYVSDKISAGIALSGVATELFQRHDLPREIPANIKLRETPFDLAKDLPFAGMAIHPGGLGYATAALFAGVPQLMIYEHDEHWVHAKAISKAQIGLGFDVAKVTAEQIKRAIHRLLDEPHFRNYAVALSQQYKPFAAAKPSKRIAGEIGLLA